MPPGWVRQRQDPDKRPPEESPTIASTSVIATTHLSDIIILPRDLKKPVPPQSEITITADDFAAVNSRFPGATRLRYVYPYFIIAGVPPPKEPISIKGLITEFWNNIEDFQYSPGHPGNPQLQDPVRPFPYNPRRFNTFEELQTLATTLEAALEIQVREITTYFHLLIIHVAAPYYDLSLLPGIVGQRTTKWIIFGTAWGGMHGIVERVNDPKSSTGDDTDYLQYGLSPGMKVCGQTRATSSGALLQNEAGEQVVTVAAHGWPAVDDNNVFHPYISQRIGRIIKRFRREEDWAFCRLDPGIAYTNRTYFEAPHPTHLLAAGPLQQNLHEASFVAADGFTTGLCWFSVVGIDFVNNIPGLQTSTQWATIVRKLRACENEVGLSVPGICGAPVVHQEDDSPVVGNACLGFLSMFDGTNGFVPVVDGLIKEGWDIAHQ